MRGPCSPGLAVDQLCGPLSRSGTEHREEGRPQAVCSGLTVGASSPPPGSSPDIHAQRPRAPVPRTFYLPPMGQPSLNTEPPFPSGPSPGSQHRACAHRGLNQGTDGDRAEDTADSHTASSCRARAPSPQPHYTLARTHAQEVLLGLAPWGQGQQTWTPLWGHRRPPISKRKLFLHVNQ